MEQIAQRVFSEQDLMRYDGSRKMPVYIAYQGVVYDVTSSPHWHTGEHRNLHYAGQDLTDELPDAPHSDLVFRKFPVVGILGK
jgi:predicted heme/steroid binding protein